MTNQTVLNRAVQYVRFTNAPPSLRITAGMVRLARGGHTGVMRLLRTKLRRIDTERQLRRIVL